MIGTNSLAARFIPSADIAERHEIVVHAPASIVSDVARHFDLQSIGIVRGIFWLRAKLLGADRGAWKKSKGLVEETRQMGWGTLLDEPGRAYAAGALAQPWLADVTFVAIPADKFVDSMVPDQVKIVWTLETDPLGPAICRFRSETRVAATDDAARLKFRRYWRMFSIGILAIRWLLLPAVRRESERRHQTRCAAS